MRSRHSLVVLIVVLAATFLLVSTKVARVRRSFEIVDIGPERSNDGRHPTDATGAASLWLDPRLDPRDGTTTVVERRSASDPRAPSVGRRDSLRIDT